jgi:uncharacterized membrane protein
MMSSGVWWVVGGAGNGVLAEVGPYDGIVDAVRVGVAALSLVLLALSLSAYRRTGLRGLLYAAASFGLFVVLVVFEFLEDAVGGPFGAPYNELISTGITLVILLLFFLAIAKGKTAPAPEESPSESGLP